MPPAEKPRAEVTILTARKLFKRARTPLEVSRLTPREIDQLIRACTFHDRKRSFFVQPNEKSGLGAPGHQAGDDDRQLSWFDWLGDVHLKTGLERAQPVFAPRVRCQCDGPNPIRPGPPFGLQ